MVEKSGSLPLSRRTFNKGDDLTVFVITGVVDVGDVAGDDCCCCCCGGEDSLTIPLPSTAFKRISLVFEVTDVGAGLLETVVVTFV